MTSNAVTKAPRANLGLWQKTIFDENKRR